MYSGYGLALDGKGEWNFNNKLAKNVINFGVNNSSSYHTDNCRNNFLTLGWGPTFDINFSKARSILTLVKKGQNYSWVCIMRVIIAIGLLRKIICKFKTNNRNVNFPTRFC